MHKSVVNQPVMGENESSRSGAVNTEAALTTRAAKDSDDMADYDSTPGKSPAFQFYANDFTTGTVTFSTEETGAYILLMCHCWDKGHIPSDMALMARIARLTPAKMRRVWGAIEGKFRATSDGWIQPRLEREREKQADFRRRQSDKASKRWESRGNATASARHMPEDCRVDALQSSVSSLQSSTFRNTDTEEKPLTQRAGEFCEWYADQHYQLFSVGYIGNPQKDYRIAQELCQKASDAELRDAALVWFGMDDDFATKGTRTLAKFASRATHCIQIARKVSA